MNAKGDLIARLVSLGLGLPAFEAESSGPPHQLTFRARVLIGTEALGPGGVGRSKKDAERAAAEAALRALDGGETPVASGMAPGETAPPGRWPVYAPVLAGALEAALDLSAADATLDDVRRDAARLYRDLLWDLGHGPENE